MCSICTKLSPALTATLPLLILALCCCCCCYTTDAAASLSQSQVVWQFWQANVSLDVSLLSFLSQSIVFLCSHGGREGMGCFFSLWQRGALTSLMSNYCRGETPVEIISECSANICGGCHGSRNTDLRVFTGHKVTHSVSTGSACLNRTSQAWDHGKPKQGQDRSLSPLWRFITPNVNSESNRNLTDENKVSRNVFENSVQSICCCRVTFNPYMLLEIITANQSKHLNICQFHGTDARHNWNRICRYPPAPATQRWTASQVAPSCFTSGSFLSPHCASKCLSKAHAAHRGTNRSVVEEGDGVLHNLKIH